MHYISLLLIWDVSWPQFVVLSGSNKTQMVSNHISSRYHHTSSTIIRHILHIARHILNYLEFGAFLKWGYQIIHLFYSDVPWNHPAGDPPWPTPRGALGRCAGCRRGLADGGERAGVAAGGASTVERCRTVGIAGVEARSHPHGDKVGLNPFEKDQIWWKTWDSTSKHMALTWFTKFTMS